MEYRRNADTPMDLPMHWRKVLKERTYHFLKGYGLEYREMRIRRWIGQSIGVECIIVVINCCKSAKKMRIRRWIDQSIGVESKKKEHNIF